MTHSKENKLCAPNSIFASLYHTLLPHLFLTASSIFVSFSSVLYARSTLLLYLRSSLFLYLRSSLSVSSCSFLSFFLYRCTFFCLHSTLYIRPSFHLPLSSVQNLRPCFYIRLLWLVSLYLHPPMLR